MSELVSLSVDGSGAAEIVIDRPERHNAMTLDMYESLLALVAQCEANSDVRCILLRGAGGRSFISGTDIGYFTDFRDGRDGVAYEAFVERVIGTVERIAKPTIAVIDGWAVGGGLALATACDFRICSDASRFGAPIAKTLSNTLSSRNIARLQAALGTPRVKDALARRLSDGRRSAGLRIRLSGLRAGPAAGGSAYARATVDSALARHAESGEGELAPHRRRTTTRR